MNESQPRTLRQRVLRHIAPTPAQPLQPVPAGKGNRRASGKIGNKGGTGRPRHAIPSWGGFLAIPGGDAQQITRLAESRRADFRDTARALLAWAIKNHPDMQAMQDADDLYGSPTQTPPPCVY